MFLSWSAHILCCCHYQDFAYSEDSALHQCNMLQIPINVQEDKQHQCRSNMRQDEVKLQLSARKQFEVASPDCLLKTLAIADYDPKTQEVILVSY